LSSIVTSARVIAVPPVGIAGGYSIAIEPPATATIVAVSKERRTIPAVMGITTKVPVMMVTFVSVVPAVTATIVALAAAAVIPLAAAIATISVPAATTTAAESLHAATATAHSAAPASALPADKRYDTGVGGAF
jgi:hypothetical protein